MKTYAILKDTWNHDNELAFHAPNEQERDHEWERLKQMKGAKCRTDRFGQETITFDSPYTGALNHIYGHTVYKKTSWNSNN